VPLVLQRHTENFKQSMVNWMRPWPTVVVRREGWVGAKIRLPAENASTLANLYVTFRLVCSVPAA
jgi:hypothetical protein